MNDAKDQEKERVSVQAQIDQALAEKEEWKRDNILGRLKKYFEPRFPDLFKPLEKPKETLLPRTGNPHHDHILAKCEENMKNVNPELRGVFFRVAQQQIARSVAPLSVQEKKLLPPEKLPELEKDPVQARQEIFKIEENKRSEKEDEGLPRELSAEAILETEFPKPVYAVPEILPEGAILFAGPPKDGKSWLIHALFVAITHGRKALGRHHCPAGDVLYFCLEDPHFLAQERVREMLGKIPKEGADDIGSVKNMKIIFRVDSIGQLMSDSEAWLKQAKNPKLVVIDTLASIMPADYDNDNFSESYKIIKGFREWAKKHHVAVIIVHHTSSKSKGLNPVAEVMGSTGLIAAPETIWVLYSRKSDRLLHTVSKIYKKKTTYLMDYEETGYWRIVKETDEEEIKTTRTTKEEKSAVAPEAKKEVLPSSNKENRILDILKNGPKTSSEISEALQETDPKESHKTRYVLGKLKDEGKIFQKEKRGAYFLRDT